MPKTSPTEKAFNNWGHNGIHLNFPNGNQVSTIWGRGSYTENHDFRLDNYGGLLKEFETFLDSETAEVMVTCSSKLLKSFIARFQGGNPFGYLNIYEWLYIVNKVAEDDKSKAKKGKKKHEQTVQKTQSL
jgi:hypothetical protein